VKFGCPSPAVVADGLVWGEKRQYRREGEEGREKRTARTLLERRLAAEASRLLHGELHETSAGRRDDRDGTSVVSGDCNEKKEVRSVTASRKKGRKGKKRTQRARALSHDRLEDTHERLRELVLEVVLRVDRNVLLENVERVFRLLVGAGILRTLDDDV
jgi:hypothetical protein